MGYTYEPTEWIRCLVCGTKTFDRIVGTMIASTSSLLLGGIITAFGYRYFKERLKDGTPFTNAGADRMVKIDKSRIYE